MVKGIVNREMLPEDLLVVIVSTVSEKHMLGITVAKDETSPRFPYFSCTLCLVQVLQNFHLLDKANKQDGIDIKVQLTKRFIYL